jgi:hypothetical protein
MSALGFTELAAPAPGRWRRTDQPVTISPTFWNSCTSE